MKPAPFTYHRPQSLDEALTLLANLADEDGRVLAGGQTLVPMMALRVAYPGHLIDINGLAELECAAVDGTDFVIGALARHAWFYQPLAPAPLGPIMQVMARHIAHHPIRTRGTVCGSLANADPASEWALLAATLDAVMVAASTDGTRQIPADEYFFGPMATALEDHELLKEVRIPLPDSADRAGFYEFNRRAGDFALGMSLCVIGVENDRIVRARVGLGAIEDAPRRLPEVEQALIGQAPTDATFRAAAQRAADLVEPLVDPQTPAEYRRSLTPVVIRRALERAFGRLDCATNDSESE